MGSGGSSNKLVVGFIAGWKGVMTNIKEQKDEKKNMDRRIDRKKILVPSMIAAAAIIATMVSVLAFTYNAQHD